MTSEDDLYEKMCKGRMYDGLIGFSVALLFAILIWRMHNLYWEFLCAIEVTGALICLWYWQKWHRKWSLARNRRITGEP